MSTRITAKKHGGNDAYSWAVFIDGKPMVTGLSRREVPYYKKQAAVILGDGPCPHDAKGPCGCGQKRKLEPVCKLPACGCTGEAHDM